MLRNLTLAACFGAMVFALSAPLSAQDELAIGDKAPLTDFKMTNIDGQDWSLVDIAGDGGTLVIFTCNTCPFVVGREGKSEGWEGRYNDVIGFARERGIGAVLVNSNEAKRKGDDSLAERYASYVLEQYAQWTDVTRITGRLVMARVQLRRGRRTAAVSHFYSASADALRGWQPLLALRAGLECGGEEGSQLVDRAVAAIGRPRDELLTEYAAACGEPVVAGWPPLAEEWRRGPRRACA